MCIAVSTPMRQHLRAPEKLLPSVQADVKEDRLASPNKNYRLPSALEMSLSLPRNYSVGPVKNPESPPLSLCPITHTVSKILHNFSLSIHLQQSWDTVGRCMHGNNLAGSNCILMLNIALLWRTTIKMPFSCKETPWSVSGSKNCWCAQRRTAPLHLLNSI